MSDFVFDEAIEYRALSSLEEINFVATPYGFARVTARIEYAILVVEGADAQSKEMLDRFVEETAEEGEEVDT